MQKKIIIGLLVCAVAALSVAFIVKKYFYSSDNQKVSASIVVPRVESEKGKSVENSSAVDEENTITSLIPLHSDETLISIVSADQLQDSRPAADSKSTALKLMHRRTTGHLQEMPKPA